MSVKVMTWVWEHSESKGTDRLVLLALADVAGDDGRVEAYARSVSHLATKTKLSASTVRARIAALVELGELVVVEQGTGRVQAKYAITMRVPESGTLDSGDERESGTQGADGPAPRAPGSGTQGADGPAPHHSVLVRPSPSPPVALELVSVEASAPPTEVEIVFDAWRESTDHPGAVLDAKRRKVITAALKSYPVGDLVEAVQGWPYSPHHRGENDRKQVYNDLGLLLRDASKIELFRDLYRQNPHRRPPTDRPVVLGPCTTCDNDQWLPQPDGSVAPCPDCSPLAVAR